MQSFNYESKNALEVDIHKYTKVKAKKFLQDLLDNINQDIDEVIIIHGYRRGNVLQGMVRKEIKNIKIKRKVVSLNAGRTSLILYNDEYDYNYMYTKQ